MNTSRAAGGGGSASSTGRAKRLLVPALFLLAVWGGLARRAEPVRRTVVHQGGDLGRSPLWFIAVYLMLVAITPVAVWVHEPLDPLAVVILTGAALVDVLRFGTGQGWAG